MTLLTCGRGLTPSGLWCCTTLHMSHALLAFIGVLDLFALWVSYKWLSSWHHIHDLAIRHSTAASGPCISCSADPSTPRSIPRADQLLRGAPFSPSCTRHATWVHCAAEPPYSVLCLGRGIRASPHSGHHSKVLAPVSCSENSTYTSSPAFPIACTVAAYELNGVCRCPVTL